MREDVVRWTPLAAATSGGHGSWAILMGRTRERRGEQAGQIMENRDPTMTMAPLRRAAGALVLALLVAGGCKPYVHGNGVFGQETRNEPPFDGVAIGLGILGTVRSGATETSVTISGDANVLQYIRTDVVDGVLTTHLSGTDGFDSDHAVQLVVATPTLSYAEAYGGARVDVSSIVEATTFTAVARDGSTLTLAGASAVQATLLAITAAGTSTIDATGYPAGDATATLTGGSRVTLTVPAPGTVTGTLSDGSTLTVKGGGTCAVAATGGAACVEAP
jgi:hypothetical protein